jgi:mono/diheme cytochrome c family protein
MPLRLCCTLIACLGALMAQPAAAQSAPQRSTKSGVYTAAQAAKGAETYTTACQGCHQPAGHSGPVFLNPWLGRPVAEFFEYISTEMPKMEPGSLTAQEYVQLVAYFLKLNGMPAGQRELPADVAALKSIRIDTAAIKKGS